VPGAAPSWRPFRHYTAGAYNSVQIGRDELALFRKIVASA
jgi:hypothetical protein